MTSRPDALKFQYSGFLQNVQISIQGDSVAQGHKVTCTANLKLPILKKNFITWTLFRDHNLDWVEHSPVAEAGSEERIVREENYSQHAIDPIGFFLRIDQGKWTEPQVKLVIGAKEVLLDVLQEKNTVTVARPEKNQKLIMKMGEKGIEALEVPIPVIGNLKIKRVD